MEQGKGEAGALLDIHTAWSLRFFLEAVQQCKDRRSSTSHAYEET